MRGALPPRPVGGNQEGGVDMNSSITVRDIDPRDKSWLKRAAREVGVSMEELVRRLIHEKRTKSESRPKRSCGILVRSTESNCRHRRGAATVRCRSPKRTGIDRAACMAD